MCVKYLSTKPSKLPRKLHDMYSTLDFFVSLVKLRRGFKKIGYCYPDSKLRNQQMHDTLHSHTILHRPLYLKNLGSLHDEIS